MMSDEEKLDVKTHAAAVEREEPQRPLRRLIGSLIEAGVSLATIPVNMLPEEPRDHMRAAGREFTRGMAALTHEIADGLERAAREPKQQ